MKRRVGSTDFAFLYMLQIYLVGVDRVMKYVSEITAEVGGNQPSMIYLLNKVDYIGSALVLDTESSGEERMTIRQLDSWGTIGVGICGLSSEGSVVCHTKKTATLHHHIDAVRTKYGTPILVDDVERVFDNGAMAGYSKGRVLYLDTGKTVLDIIGLRGSVCIWPGDSSKRLKVYTLYDALGCLCRNTGVNLMSYKELHLYSDVRRTTTTIELSDSAEAKRFFTKMYLDVLR